jgi:hypothetical protein
MVGSGRCTRGLDTRLQAGFLLEQSIGIRGVLLRPCRQSHRDIHWRIKPVCRGKRVIEIAQPLRLFWFALQVTVHDSHQMVQRPEFGAEKRQILMLTSRSKSAASTADGLSSGIVSASESNRSSNTSTSPLSAALRNSNLNWPRSPAAESTASISLCEMSPAGIES